MIEVDSPSGQTMAQARQYVEKYHPGCTVRPLAPLPAPTPLYEALAAACESVEGITVAEFRALLSPEDIKDIEAGGIHPKTLHAFAQSFAGVPCPISTTLAARS